MIACFGLDLGISRDRAVLAGVGTRAPDYVCVESLLTWTPTRQAKVDLIEVEREAQAAALATGAPIVLDPWQGVLMSARMRAAGCQVMEYAFSGDGRKKLFSLLLDLIRTGRLRCPPHEELRRELLGLQVEAQGSGFRVDHHPGRHDDHVIAIGLAVTGLAAMPAAVTPEDLRDMDRQERHFMRSLGFAAPPEPYGGWGNYVQPDYITPDREDGGETFFDSRW